MNHSTRAGGIPKLGAAIEAAIALVDLLKADDQVTVIGFNSAPKVGAPLTVDKDAVRAALRRLPESQKSGTRIDLGLATAHEELDGPRHRSENHRSIVLVTDGRQVGPPGNEAVLEVARAIKADRISIVTIGLGEDADEPLLRELASQPDYYFRAPDAEDLLALYREIARFIPCP
jgi:Mg-chelatase subunit ChlD